MLDNLGRKKNVFEMEYGQILAFTAAQRLMGSKTENVQCRTLRHFLLPHLIYALKRPSLEFLD